MDKPGRERVFVAGATGDLGRELIPVLHAHGKEVVALVRPGRHGSLEPLAWISEEIVSTEVTEPDVETRVLGRLFFVAILLAS